MRVKTTKLTNLQAHWVRVAIASYWAYSKDGPSRLSQEERKFNREGAVNFLEGGQILRSYYLKGIA